MKKHFVLFFAFAIIFTAEAQKNIKSVKVTYLRSNNGKVFENQDPILLFTSEKLSLVTTEKITLKKANFPIEQTYVDFQLKNILQLAEFKNNSAIISLDSLALGKQKFTITDQTKKILGYTCKKATTSINSNSIELWFTTDLNLKGAPTALGQDLGLVLEMVRNGNSKTTASKIEILKNIPAVLNLPNPLPKKVDQLTYKDLLWKSRFTTVPIFKKEIINFMDNPKSNDSILKFASGTIILKKVKFPKIKKGSNVFIDVTEQSNGDAYDRTGSVFLIPTDQSISFLDGLQKGAKSLPIYENGNGEKYQGVVRTENYTPLLELMRFFTPFGVKHFNNLELKNKVWQDSVYYRQDITELTTALDEKEVWIGMNIGNYDNGGHKVSLNITIHPGYEAKSGDKLVLPLFNTNNVMEMAGQQYATMFNNEKGLELTFEVPASDKNYRLRYITTGHGGWGNGDEFVPKKNTILLDGKEIFAFVPWRTDCGSYRLSNPASGNFNDGLSSSDLSRSNWCPGTVTPPVYIELGKLSAGKHSMQIKIPQGAPEGTSFSSWNVSGVLIAD